MTPAPDSPAAYTLVDKVRTEVHAIPGAQAKVGGGPRHTRTWRPRSHDRDLLIPLILGVVLLILGLLLRAIVAPLVLIATVVLSFASALGISALFFKHVFGFAGADTGMPLFVFVFLVALGIDYNIFLMTRVRRSIRSGTRRGALTGWPRPAASSPRRAWCWRHLRHARHASRWWNSPRSGSRSRSASCSTRSSSFGAGDRADPGYRTAHLVAQRAGTP